MKKSVKKIAKIQKYEVIISFFLGFFFLHKKFYEFSHILLTVSNKVIQFKNVGLRIIEQISKAMACMLMDIFVLHQFFFREMIYVI